jgi:hypothetical protein
MNVSREEKEGDRVVRAKAHVKFADGEDFEILKQQPKPKPKPKRKVKRTGFPLALFCS